MWKRTACQLQGPSNNVLVAVHTHTHQQVFFIPPLCNRMGCSRKRFLILEGDHIFCPVSSTLNLTELILRSSGSGGKQDIFLLDFSSTKIRPCRAAGAARTRLSASEGAGRERSKTPRGRPVSTLQAAVADPPSPSWERDPPDDSARRALVCVWKPQTLFPASGVERPGTRRAGPENRNDTEFEPPREPLWTPLPGRSPAPRAGSAWGDARGAGPVGDRGLRTRQRRLAGNYISHNYSQDAYWCGGSHGNLRPSECEAGRTHSGPEEAEAQEAAERNCWPRPQSPPFGGRRFPFWGSVCPRHGRRLEFLQAPGFSANHEESREEKRSLGATHPKPFPARDRPGRDGRQDLAALPGAPPGRSAPSAAAGGGRLRALLRQRLHVHPSGRPEGVFLPAHAPEGLAGDRVPSKCGGWASLLPLSPMQRVVASHPLRNFLLTTRVLERRGPPGEAAKARRRTRRDSWAGDPEVGLDLGLTTRPLPFPPVGKRPALVMPGFFPLCFIIRPSLCQPVHAPGPRISQYRTDTRSASSLDEMMTLVLFTLTTLTQFRYYKSWLSLLKDFWIVTVWLSLNPILEYFERGYWCI